MDPKSGDRTEYETVEGAWLGASPPKRYAEISQSIDMKQLEVLNLHSDHGSPQALFKNDKPSSIASTEENTLADVDWVESDVDEQLMLFIPFRGTSKAHTIQITSLPPKISENDDEYEELPMRPKTIHLYTNKPHILHFEEADSLTPTQTLELRSDDWDANTGTATLALRFVKFQNISSLVMYIADGEGSGDKVRLDRVRLFGESTVTKTLPEHLEHGNAATRKRGDDQLAFAAGKDFIVGTTPRGGILNHETYIENMAADLAWQIGGLLQGSNKLAADDDWLDRERWHRMGGKIKAEKETSNGTQPVEVQDEWQLAVERREAHHNNLAQRGVKLWGLRGRAPEADIRGYQSPPKLEHNRLINSLADLMVGKHSCDMCDRLIEDIALQALNSAAPLKIPLNLLELKERAESCNFYMIVLSSTEPQSFPDISEIKIFAEPLCLSVESRPTDIQTTSIPRVFVEVVSSTEVGNGMRFPLLPESCSELEIRLCKQWLQLCDSCYLHTESYDAQLPTRVLDVGSLESTSVRLRITNGEAYGKYIALSHRWHKDTPTTTTENLHDRRHAIKVSSLPQIYQDAVRVTRKLGVQFLWIDSLCILQDDPTDWFFEAGKMEGIYSLAYCTIAASSAGDKHGNFEQHVDKGELSQRGWILQERALSRRTIHITGKQTYFECSFAIWSKTDDVGRKPRNSLASSDFPWTDAIDPPKSESATLQDVFAHYSRLHLTVKADRPVAIAGIERRLQDAYETRSYYGIFQKFFIESLLWKRAPNNWLEPLIDFTGKVRNWTVSGYRVPSWSWMACTGEIGYVEIPSDGVSCTEDTRLICTKSEEEWEDTSYGHSWHAPEDLAALSGTLLHLRPDCALKGREDLDCEIRDGDDVVGWASYDCNDERNSKCRECISIAERATTNVEYAGILRTDTVYCGTLSYVMLLAQEDTDVYRRIGVSVVRSDCLSPSNTTVRVF